MTTRIIKGSLRYWSLVALLLDKEKKMKRLNQSELLESLEKLVASARVRQLMYYGSREEQAHKQIKELIMLEKKNPRVTEEFVEKWINIIRPETPVSIRLAIKDMLKEAGVEVEGE